MAPELLLEFYPHLSTQNLLKVDVWSSGVVICSIALWRAYKRTMFQHSSVRGVLRQGAQQVLQQLSEGGHNVQERTAQAARNVNRRRAGAEWKSWEVHMLLEQVGMDQVLDGCPELAANMGPHGVELLKGMLALDPENRCSLELAIWDPFFTGERQHLLESPGAVGASQPLQQLVAEAQSHGKCGHGKYIDCCTACLHPG
jgi:serine/threonine protein kinase